MWRFANRVRLLVETPLVRGSSVDRGPARNNQVALTFDDGPDPRFTPRIVEILDRANARGTFFMLGPAIEAHPELAREVARRHQVGTHLYAHDIAKTRDLAAFEAELATSLGVHRTVLGAAPTALRYPFGSAGRIRPHHLAPHQLVAYHWTFSALDWKARSPDAILDRVVPRLYPGAIVLLHDGCGANSTGKGSREHTVAALPRILDAIAARGLRAVTVDELVATDQLAAASAIGG